MIIPVDSGIRALLLVEQTCNIGMYLQKKRKDVNTIIPEGDRR